MNEKLKKLLEKVEDKGLRAEFEEAIREHVNEERDDAYTDGYSIGWDNAMDVE